MTSPLTNRSIVITGGTGSFAQAFARRALDAGASRVVCFSRDELKQSEMRAKISDPRLRFMIGSVTDPERVERALRGAELVVHAAAMKQVPACEQNPWECVETNIYGTQNVASSAISNRVQKAVFLSTDKAAAPNTHYGASKLAAERLWINSNVYAAGTSTRLCATRYGNVIGSRGSVVPIFREQAKSGVLTITDRRMTRFWMTLEQAVNLVELALGESRGGEVFIPKVGACGIETIASAVAPNASTRETGIRRGEKLHETLIAEDEARNTYDMGDHYRIEPDRTWEPHLPELGARMPEGFSYRSDTNPQQYSVEDMRLLIGEPKARKVAA